MPTDDCCVAPSARVSHQVKDIVRVLPTPTHTKLMDPRTRYTGPHAQVPSLVEVQEILHELAQWKQQAPEERYSKRFPQQSPDRVQATYTQAVLLLIRPILMAKEIHPDLIGMCVEFAVEACSVCDDIPSGHQTTSKNSIECENTELESTHTARSHHSVPLLLLWRDLVAVLGHLTNSIDGATHSPGNKRLPERIGSIYPGTARDCTFLAAIRGSFESFGL